MAVPPTTTTIANATTRTGPPMMYLAFEDWSPRFDSQTFYTIKVDGYELRTPDMGLPTTSSPGNNSSPPSTTAGGKTNLPAYYYKIIVCCGHQTNTIMRRYSQFEWLYRTLPKSVTTYEEPLILPPKCSCQQQNDSFAQNRMEQLRDFLRDALVRRGVAEHDATVQFLELNFLGEETTTSSSANTSSA